MTRAIASAALLLSGLFTATHAANTRAALVLQVYDADLANGIAEPLSAILLKKARMEIVSEPHADVCDLVLTCRVRRTGYRIDSRLVDASEGRVFARESIAGSEDEIFSLVDRMAQMITGELEKRGDQNTVAVLDFANEAGDDSGPIASGLPAMMMTAMRQTSHLTLLERVDVERSMAKSRLETAAGLSVVETAELSQWLGADVAVIGTLTDALEVELAAAERDTDKPLGIARRVGPRTVLSELIAGVALDLTGELGSHVLNTRTVAVLPFENHGSDQYDALVSGIPDMLTTTLGQATIPLTVIERVQIDKAMRNFNLEMSGPIDSDTAVEVGAWLGADAVALGSFLRFGRVFRIDARLIDAETGEVMIAQSVTGGEDDVLTMVDSLGRRLLQRVDERETDRDVGTGTLKVAFRTVKSEMGERPVYHHICKLYVDGDFMGLSPVVDRPGRWTTLFDKRIRAGAHRVEIVHGYVRDVGWDGQMDEQPRRFAAVVEPGSVTTIKYTYEVGWFNDQYVYEP